MIDCLRWTFKIQYAVQFLQAIAWNGENYWTDLKNSFFKWCHVGQTNIKCCVSSTPAFYAYYISMAIETRHLTF